jgi:hypothetical protein
MSMNASTVEISQVSYDNQRTSITLQIYYFIF